MEEMEDATSMLPYLPLELRSSRLSWPPATMEALEAMSRGPEHSRVESGEVLARAVSHMRDGSQPFFAPFAAEGYALFFDEVLRIDHQFRLLLDYWFPFYSFIWVCVIQVFVCI